MRLDHHLNLIKNRKNLKYFNINMKIKSIMNNNNLKYLIMLDNPHHLEEWFNKTTYQIIHTHNILKINHILLKIQIIICLKLQIIRFLNKQTIISLNKYQIKNKINMICKRLFKEKCKNMFLNNKN